MNKVSILKHFNPASYATNIKNDNPLTDEEFDNILKQKNIDETYSRKKLSFNPEVYVVL